MGAIAPADGCRVDRSAEATAYPIRPRRGDLWRWRDHCGRVGAIAHPSAIGDSAHGSPRAVKRLFRPRCGSYLPSSGQRCAPAGPAKALAPASAAPACRVDRPATLPSLLYPGDRAAVFEVEAALGAYRRRHAAAQRSAEQHQRLAQLSKPVLIDLCTLQSDRG